MKTKTVLPWSFFIKIFSYVAITEVYDSKISPTQVISRYLTSPPRFLQFSWLFNAVTQFWFLDPDGFHMQHAGTNFLYEKSLISEKRGYSTCTINHKYNFTDLCF